MLLECFKDKSAGYGIESPIKQTKYLRNELQRRFPDEIDFAPVGKYIIVYMSDMNPCEYSIATLKGQGLCDSDHIKSFSNCVRRKIESLSFKDLPTSLDELIEEFDKSEPTPDLYNVIYATMHERNYKLNNHGYAVTDSVAIAN